MKTRQSLVLRDVTISISVLQPHWHAALAWALETDADTRAILQGCPPLDLAHGVLQTSARRTHWSVSVCAGHISVQRIDTSAGGAVVSRTLRLPPRLSRRSA